jgi:hypothetical protein
MASYVNHINEESLQSKEPRLIHGKAGLKGKDLAFPSFIEKEGKEGMLTN